MDIADTDGDGVIDMVAVGQGWEQNVSYATRSSVGGQWSTNNYAGIGEFVAADVTIDDINGDGKMDFLVPTMLTVSTVNSAGAGQQQQLTTDNLVDINTVNIILNDGSGNYLSPQTFDVGRRPTMVIADQFSGGANSALDLAVGQRIMPSHTAMVPCGLIQRDGPELKTHSQLLNSIQKTWELVAYRLSCCL